MAPYVNGVILTLGALVWLILLYVPLMAGGTIIYASDPIGVTATGMGGIYYIPLLVFWPLAGIFLVTILIVWHLTALGVFAFVGDLYL